jgi:hypothetical protein
VVLERGSGLGTRLDWVCGVGKGVVWGQDCVCGVGKGEWFGDKTACVVLERGSGLGTRLDCVWCNQACVDDLVLVQPICVFNEPVNHHLSPTCQCLGG